MKNESNILDYYLTNYNLQDKAKITLEQVNYHFDLERELTQQLLSSEKENRTETFINCYTKLYQEIYWLNDANTNDHIDTSILTFSELLEPPPKKILEIGSGKAELINYLGAKGYKCKGTEITLTRGEKFSESNNIEWGFTDGVNLDKYEMLNTYDYVLSNQVIEHLHPDDIFDHLNSVKQILKTGGSYIFNTPHRFTGPHDISKIFGYSEAVGMHLKEYTFSELAMKLKVLGYKKLYTPNYIRYISKIVFNRKHIIYLSSFILKLVIILEKMHWLIPRVLYKKLFTSVFIVAIK